MDTVMVNLEVPKDVLFAARIEEEVAAAELKKQLSIHLFETKLLTLGKAAEFANMSRWDFMELLGSLKIPIHYSLEDWKRDKETLEELSK